MKKALSFLILVSVLALLLCPPVSAEPLPGIDGPCYMTLSPTSTLNGMSVTWWDTGLADTGCVEYGGSPNFSGGALGTATAVRMASDPVNGFSVFTATLTGLDEGVTYYYRVGHDEMWSEVKSFTTGSQADAFSFFYMGDIQYQSFDTAQADYNTWGALLESVTVSYPDVRFGVLGGDMVQQGQAPSCWQMFFGQATKVFSTLPMIAVPGNHESNASNGKPAMYLDMFNLPANGPAGLEEEFYSYDYGNCHFACLSSTVLAGEQVALGGMQAADYDAVKTWIASDLASSDATWKVIVLHHPPHAVVSDAVATAVLEEWEPLFVDAQVDLVLCGHQHVYMRTKAIRGVTEVMGNSGSKFYAPADVGYSRCMIPYVSTYEVISVTPSELSLTAVDPAGNILDAVTLQPKDRSETPVWSDLTGDFDNDYELTEYDVGLLKAFILSAQPYDGDYDLNNDGRVNIADAHLLALAVLNNHEIGGEL